MTRVPFFNTYVLIAPREITHTHTHTRARARARARAHARTHTHRHSLFVFFLCVLSLSFSLSLSLSLCRVPDVLVSGPLMEAQGWGGLQFAAHLDSEWKVRPELSWP
eukprot:COSAG03_NODE_730_length_6062_cov_9.830790_6_plen_107_part_00